MSTYKLSKDLKKKMERELRQYYENKKQLEKLKQNNNISTRKYLYIEQRLIFVENVYNMLKPFEKQIYEYIFKNNLDSLYVETHYHVSRSTYYNVFNKSIYLLAQEWGEI